MQVPVGHLLSQRLDILINDDGNILGHAQAQFTESLQRAFGHLVTAQQHGLGQPALACRPARARV